MGRDRVIFPKDCPRTCQYLHSWDMSIDDWTNVCDLLNAQIDDCDMDFIYLPCPLDEESRKPCESCQEFDCYGCEYKNDI